jgi:hypothetical protein
VASRFERFAPDQSGNQYLEPPKAAVVIEDDSETRQHGKVENEVSTPSNP